MPRSVPDAIKLRPSATIGAIAYVAILLLTAYCAGNGWFGADWLSIGDLQAGAAREWWRAVTALTLHLDQEHLLGNLLFGVLAGLAGIIGVPAAPWPPAILAAAYVILGLQIGSQFDAAVVEQLKRLGFFVVLSNFFLLGVSVVLAIGLMPLLKIDLLSAYLAATPGGLDSVAAMATDLRADAALILAVHSLRLISVLIVGPLLVQIVARRLVTDG